MPKELEEKFIRLNELVRQVEDQLASIKEASDEIARSTSDSGEQKTAFMKIAEALLSKGNNPKTARWIMKEARVSRGSLSQVIHRTHKEAFISVEIPGYSRKKLWALTKEAADEVAGQLRAKKRGQATLFDDERPQVEFLGVKATDCCVKILLEHDNEAMNALTMAREALRRGYRGKAHGSEDEVLLTTAKSFWAALGRDERFVEIRALVFKLKNHPIKLPGEKNEE